MQFLKQHTQEVSAPDFAEVLIRETLCLKAARKMNHVGSRSQSGDTTIPIEITTYTYVVNTCHLNHVEYMTHGIIYGCALRFSEKTRIESSLRNATLLCEGAELVIRKIAWVITERTCRRMRAGYGTLATL